MRASLSSDVIIEPAVERFLHRRQMPIELKQALPLQAMALPTAAGGAPYSVNVVGGGRPLAAIDVMFYLRDPGGQLRTTTVKTNEDGQAKLAVPAGRLMSYVEPIPYAGFWIMVAEAPPSGSTVECLPIAPAGAGGGAWWHSVMGVDVNAAGRGAGVKVGVIETGCGPHPNLAHVTLVGAFVDAQVLPAAQGTDVAEHGTHTSGIIGARPGKAGDYAGVAPDCELFHARVFKDEDHGATQADIIHAIDALSRDHGCDLINMSLGGGPRSEAEEDAIKDAAQRGTLCVCSAGNEAGPIGFPGAYPECDAVSAIGLISDGRPRALFPPATDRSRRRCWDTIICSWPPSAASVPSSPAPRPASASYRRYRTVAAKRACTWKWMGPPWRAPRHAAHWP